MISSYFLVIQETKFPDFSIISIPGTKNIRNPSVYSTDENFRFVFQINCSTNAGCWCFLFKSNLSTGLIISLSITHINLMVVSCRELSIINTSVLRFLCVYDVIKYNWFQFLCIIIILTEFFLQSLLCLLKVN